MKEVSDTTEDGRLDVKQIILWFALLILIQLNSCNSISFKTPIEPTTTQNDYKAVYLSDGIGEISIDDLKAHPEVRHAQSFHDFKTLAESKTALLVDRNAVALVDNRWLNSPLQKYYPLVIVGYNNPLYCFRDMLRVGFIEGPFVDWSKEAVEPGFCVWMIGQETSKGQSAFFPGLSTNT